MGRCAVADATPGRDRYVQGLRGLAVCSVALVRGSPRGRALACVETLLTLLAREAAAAAGLPVGRLFGL